MEYKKPFQYPYSYAYQFHKTTDSDRLAFENGK